MKKKSYTLDQLAGMDFYNRLDLPDYLKRIPHTACGDTIPGTLQYPSIKILKFIHGLKNCLWKKQLYLAAFVISANGLSPHSTSIYIRKCAYLFSKYLMKINYSESDLYGDDLVISASMINSVMEKMFESARLTDNQKAEYFHKYGTLAKRVSAWFYLNHKVMGFSGEFYQRLLFPEVTSTKVIVLGNRFSKHAMRKAQAKKKDETDVVFRSFRKIAVESRNRLNTFERFYAATVKAEKEAITNRSLSCNYSYYDEGGLIRLRLVHIKRLADEVKASLNHNLVKALEPYFYIINAQVIEFKSCYYFVEIVEVPKDNHLWFLELATNGMLNVETSRTSSCRKQFLKDHGYTSGQFYFHYLSRAQYEGVIVAYVDSIGVLSKRAFVSPHELRLQVYLAALAVELMVTTGARINEVLQLSADPGCLKVVKVTSSSGAPLEKYVAMLIPKGAEVPTPFFLTQETFNLMVSAYDVISDNYRIFNGKAEVRSLAPNPLNKKYHILKSRRYVFQVNGNHLEAMSLMTAVRVLIHNIKLTYIGEDGRTKQLALKAHLLRHAFSTFAVHAQKIPVDVVAKMLNQKNIDVTRYYSEATLSIMAEHHQSLSGSLFDSVNLDKLVSKSTDEVKLIYKETLNQVGALTEVLGGTCLSHSLCTAKMACIGCDAKVPDPAKKNAIERKLNWARDELEWSKAHGFGAEVRKCEVLINSCLNELLEISEIERNQVEQQKEVAVFLDEPIVAGTIKNDE